MPSPLWRVMALLSAGMVMILALSSVSPEIHALLHSQAAVNEPQACAHHGHEHSPASGSQEADEHGCAVTMFSHGVVYQVVALFTPPCEGILRAVDFRAFERLALAQPRFLHLPPHAPPAV